ncbi:MAG: hypothetical protein HYY25_02090 [Candidatus Wallbacteria bacterium]|nr:hypothetical protein [Candidatus Wallbacteria bacterium]MBI4866847.1 hypothetical protein [Candidatus Wallbacteria bacterium]
MIRNIEHFVFLPLVLAYRLFGMVVRPLIGFGMHHIGLLLLAAAVYGICQPYWRGILGFLHLTQ